VRGNLLYGARGGSMDGLVRILDIHGLLDRRVANLSGGERQRVAIGRALMTTPALLLLDEPLAGVDRLRREQILPYLLRVRRELHVPLVYVTHDASELLQIADRVLVLDNGRVRSAGTPREALPVRADDHTW
jgi:molybdate transport system ATP-binding protein